MAAEPIYLTEEETLDLFYLIQDDIKRVLTERKKRARLAAEEAAKAEMAEGELG